MTLAQFPKKLAFSKSWYCTHEKTLDFFPEMTLAQFPKPDFWNFHWIFFPEMTLAQFPKPDFLNFRWIFFPKMTLAQFPVFGFFFQDSQIGVNSLFCWSMENNETYRITYCAFIAKLSLNKLLVTHELGFNLRLALSQIKNVPGASSVLTNMRTFKNVSQNMFGS